MKIRSVSLNNHRKTFELHVGRRRLGFPYAEATPRPTASDPVVSVRVDAELAREGFSFTLESGREGAVHVEQVLEYNADPAYLRELLLYNLTVEAKRRVATSHLSKRELVRRLRTSASQFYRLLDQTNYRKSVDEMLRLLHVLDCEVRMVVRAKTA